MIVETYLGEIRMFAGTFSPSGWALCNGQLIAITGNDALFSLIGTTYGGDGRTNFALPDLRGRLPLHYGNGPGLRERTMGERFGFETIPLAAQNLPSHSHSFMASSVYAARREIQEGVLSKTAETDAFYTGADLNVEMDSRCIGMTGQGLSHNNMMPYSCINFIIALQGEYPSRT